MSLIFLSRDKPKVLQDRYGFFPKLEIKFFIFIMIDTESIHVLLSCFTVIGQVVLILCLINFFSPLKIGRTDINKLVRQNAYTFSLAVSLLATIGSLYYSKVAGYSPCELCWYQRIFMYPQAILFGIALYKNQQVITPYSLALSILGGGIALYHYLLQMKVLDLSTCPVGVESCSETVVKKFGYITIPMMSLTAFSLLIIFMTTLLKKK